MSLTPTDIQTQTFHMTFRGFSPVEVDSFLDRVADAMGRLIEEKQALQDQLEAEKIARKNLDEALAAGRTLQAELIETARQDAEVIVNQAKIKADRLLAEANEELVRLRDDIRKRRDQRSLWLSELKGMARALEVWAEGKKSEPIAIPELIADEEEEDNSQIEDTAEDKALLENKAPLEDEAPVESEVSAEGEASIEDETSVEDEASAEEDDEATAETQGEEGEEEETGEQAA